MAKKDTKKDGSLARPPIVAVLGHVDHGKTSLLDKIRQTKIAEREAGGITQKIGAYQVEIDGQKITFIDTPGHQAFSAMRSRGASVADLAILVVAADDGVMPQTLESVEHIRRADIPFLVAINKIDLPAVDVERIKSQLVENGIAIEGYGGDVVCVPVSAKTGQGIDDLLEMILLLAQMREIKADPWGILSGVIIESKKESRGPVATIIVKNGTLKIGDLIQAMGKTAKIKGMFDENGKSVPQAEPGKPVEILGFSEIPPVGAPIVTASIPSEIGVSFTSFTPQLEVSGVEPKLKIIIKADSQGSLEAISSNLPGEVFLILKGVGQITESDVLLAQTSNAEIWGFNVKIPNEVEKLAQTEKVKVQTFKIIYEFLENLEKRILGSGQPQGEEEILGEAEIIAEFAFGGQRVAGSRVLKGRTSKNDNLQLKRGEKIIGEVKALSMKHLKVDINEAKVGEEFGIIFASPIDFKVGDMLISRK